MKNKTKEIGAEVIVRNGTCSAGGMFITETLYTAVIEKINAKSVRVRFEHIKIMRTGNTSELITDRKATGAASFPFWKEVNGRVLYKNSHFGILEF
jgi:hypothetical protein